MNYDQYHEQFLNPDFRLPGGNGSTPPVNVFNIQGSLGLQKYKAIEQPAPDDYYERNRKFIEQSLWEQEEAENEYLRSHGVPM